MSFVFSVDGQRNCSLCSAGGANNVHMQALYTPATPAPGEVVSHPETYKEFTLCAWCLGHAMLKLATAVDYYNHTRGDPLAVTKRE